MKRLTELLNALMLDLQAQNNNAGATICVQATKEIDRLERLVDWFTEDKNKEAAQ
jgi:hypothetical protein